MTNPANGMVKVVFRLQRDADGYPPADAEGLWATQLGNNRFKLENIPFFAWGVSADDVVQAEPIGQEYYFERVVTPSGHSTVRIIAYDKSSIPEIRKAIEELGCSSELSHLPSLVAIDIPPDVDWSKVFAFLKDAEARELLEYEESAPRYMKRKESWWKVW